MLKLEVGRLYQNKGMPHTLIRIITLYPDRGEADYNYLRLMGDGKMQYISNDPMIWGASFAHIRKNYIEYIEPHTWEV